MPVILRPKNVTGLWTQRGSVLDMELRTPQQYRIQQIQHVALNPAISDPVEFSNPMQTYIGNGAWRISCPCGEATHADPEWNLSCCFGCGAIYTNLIVPVFKTVMERLLVKRRIQRHRNWHPSETLQNLIDEQIAFGDPT